MKKIFVLVVMLMALVVTVSANAESIDLEGLSLDELVSLRNRIADIISARTVSSENEIYGGRYIVGEDIKPGKYIISVIRHPETYRNGELGIYIKNESGEYVRDKLEHLSIGEEYYLDLTEGMMIVLDIGVGTIRETVKPFWEP